MDRQFRTRFFRRQFQTRPSRNVGAFQEILAAEDDADKNVSVYVINERYHKVS